MATCGVQGFWKKGHGRELGREGRRARESVSGFHTTKLCSMGGAKTTTLANRVPATQIYRFLVDTPKFKTGKRAVKY
jgi:hypothetical protein